MALVGGTTAAMRLMRPGDCVKAVVFSSSRRTANDYSARAGEYERDTDHFVSARYSLPGTEVLSLYPLAFADDSISDKVMIRSWASVDHKPETASLGNKATRCLASSKKM
jgi:hypothetical protein